VTCRPLPSIALLAASLLLVGAGARADEQKIAGDRERGRSLVAQFQCGRCHEVPGVEGARGSLAPSLARLGARRYLAGQLPNGPVTLARWIVDPAALLPGAAMPAMGVDAVQARDIAAYLLSLR
jgi:cytochrome c